MTLRVLHTNGSVRHREPPAFLHAHAREAESPPLSGLPVQGGTRRREAFQGERVA